MSNEIVICQESYLGEIKSYEISKDFARFHLPAKVTGRSITRKKCRLYDKKPLPIVGSDIQS